MEYRKLGRSGVQVSVIGLGGTPFGERCDAQQTAALVHQALDLGINHFDTADVYGGYGTSERYLGAALAGHRRCQAILASKVGVGPTDGPNTRGISRRRIISSCEESLRRLQTEYIDLYYFHEPDPQTDIEESLEALDTLIRQGKVRYLAISNYVGWQIARLCERGMARGYPIPILTQSPYNLLYREIEREVLPAASAYGLGLVPYTPLARGLLTGVYKRGQPIAPGTRAAVSPRFRALVRDDVLRVVADLEGFAQERGRTISDLAIAWLLAQPSVCSIVIGMVKPEEVDMNTQASHWRLDATELAALQTISSRAPADLNTDV